MTKGKRDVSLHTRAKKSNKKKKQQNNIELIHVLTKLPQPHTDSNTLTMYLDRLFVAW